MQFTLNPYIAIPIVTIAGLAAIGLWYVFVRPVEQLTGEGIIVGREFREAQTVEKTSVRNYRGPEYISRHSSYTLPDRFVYQIRIDGVSGDVAYAAPSVANQQLEVGTRVWVTYSRRGLPFVWNRVYVSMIEALP